MALTDAERARWQQRRDELVERVRVAATGVSTNDREWELLRRCITAAAAALYSFEIDAQLSAPEPVKSCATCGKARRNGGTCDASGQLDVCIRSGWKSWIPRTPPACPEQPSMTLGQVIEFCLSCGVRSSAAGDVCARIASDLRPLVAEVKALRAIRDAAEKHDCRRKMSCAECLKLVGACTPCDPDDRRLHDALDAIRKAGK